MRFNHVALTSVIVACLVPATAFAHAQLLKAVPGVGSTTAAPAALSLSFSEAVEPRFCGVSLTNAAGEPVPLGKPALGASNMELTTPVPGKLGAGTYTVVWHAVSVDTHRTQGKFTFTVAP